MQWNRIYAIMLRHLVQLPQDVNQWTSIIFWPLLNITLFGMTGAWLHESAPEALFALVSGVALWQFVIRTNFGISLGFLQEVFSHNVTNLFSTPLTIFEWMCAMVLNGLILGAMTLSFCIAIVWVMFGFNMLTLSPFLWYTVLQLYIAGTGVGLLGASLLMLWGTKVQTIIFMVGVAAAPISGAFYPIDMLPASLQSIAYCLPFAHIFHGLFSYIQYGTWSISNIGFASLTNAILVTGAALCFVASFYASKQTGFKHTQE